MILQEQNNQKVYSDGSAVEKEMLSIAQKYPEDKAQDFIANCSKYTINNTFSSVRENILNWYPFKDGADILEIGAGMGSLTGLLCDKANQVVSLEMSETRAAVIKARYPERDNLTIVSADINHWETEQRFDYIVFIGVLEYAGVFSDASNPYEEFLLRAKNLLKDDGIILFAIENRFGLKYFLGASEDHLQEPYVGIEGYVAPHTPRTFSKKELECMLENVGLTCHRMYSVLPDYKFPELIFSEEYTPDFMNLKKVSFTYSRNSSLISDEKKLYKHIIDNNVFPFFANSFLFEASCASLDKKHVVHVSSKGEVYKEFRVSTLIDNEGNVYKVPMHKNALTHIRRISENTQYLASRGVNILPAVLKGNTLWSRKLKATAAQKAFSEALLSNNNDLIYQMIDALKTELLKSCDVLEYNINNIIDKNNLGPGNIDYGPILQKAFIDMTFYNAFWENGKLTFYDQEWCFDRVPLKFCLFYAIKSVYVKTDGTPRIQLSAILDYLQISAEEKDAFDKLEEFIWSDVLYRQTDFYGEDGYCNRFNENLTRRYQELDKNSTLKKKENEAANLAQKLEELTKEHSIYASRIAELETELQKCIDSERSITKQAIEDCSKKLQDYDRQIAEYKSLTEELRQTIRNKEGHIELLLDTERQLAEYKSLTEELRQIIRNKEGHIELLLDTEREYEREKRSRTYRMALCFRKISVFFLPPDSKRRFLLSMLAKTIRHPRLMLKVINPRRIKNFFVIAKKEGLGSVNTHYRLVEEMERSRLYPNAADKLDIIKPLKQEATFEDYQPMRFEGCEAPLVSIIIPVYNAFDFTYNCLCSILNNSAGISYEIIIADDCSTDLTTRIAELVDGIKVVRSDKNLRFLKNCNHAAKYAKGKYLLFLNNDTQVQPDWLSSLTSLMESDDTIGYAGSKLIYSDGWLQEAGGIIWNDASAWNYGHRKDPNAPEYNYVREVDYISGAAIMIRTELWHKIGGFDELFSPAYYEDSDLAFEVRRNGYKVVYQPQSVVVHFEGISNGTDLNEGQKKYQVENQKKFYLKWKDVLDKEHFPNGEKVFLANDRSRSKKHILIIDHYVPHFDKDAGGKTTYMYMCMLARHGYQVVFMGDNFYQHEPYTSALQQQGVYVLYGPEIYNNWKQWLKDNGNYFDYVYFNRPHITIKYLDIVRECCNAKLLYYAVDLHYLREYRQYEINKDPKSLQSSEKWKKIEFEIVNKVDVVHVVGSYEQEVLQKLFPEKPIRNIPVFIYEELLEGVQKDFSKREDIVFVGGFAHPPNTDAVLWFAKDIFPKILERYPEMKWHVVGNQPPEEIRQLASNNILIEGFMEDDALHTLYHKCRMAVVPLRFGAGVKGKVVEAAYYQLPVITTPIGAEGLDTGDGSMIVADSAEDFAEKVISLYEDYQKLMNISDNGIAFIQNHYMLPEAERILGLDIQL